MSLGFDERMDDAIATGRENARIIELAQNHCQHMTFTVAGGYGMLEEVSGLPINMRAISCVKAHGNSAATRLRQVARSFYTEHCVGCVLRKPSGGLPTLASLVEEDERADAELVRQAEERDAESARLRAERGKRRKALEVSADPAMVGALHDLDVLDSNLDEDDAVHRAALRRLSALAEKAPKTFTDDVVEEMLRLIERGQPRLLGPLRIVCKGRAGWRQRAVDAAAAVLVSRASNDAARMLVQFSELTTPEMFDESTVRSILYVAYGPANSDFGFFEASTATDPAALKLLVDRAGEEMAGLLERMLPGPSEGSTLELPAGTRTAGPETTPHAEFDRATAAAAVGQLLVMGEPMAVRFVPALIRNLLVDGDEYNTHPHAAVEQALARFILSRVEDAEERWWSAGKSASDEQRQTLFRVWWQLSRLVDSARGWESSDPRLTVEHRQELRNRVLEVSMRLSAGEWGHNVAGAASDVVLDLARDDPEWAVGHTDAFLGGFLAALKASEEPRSRVLLPNDQIPDPLADLEWTSRGMILRSAATRFLDAARAGARADAVLVLQAVLAFLDHERELGNELEVSWRLIPLLGEIGRDTGEMPGVLRLVLPALYTYLMNPQPALVAKAIAAWTETGSRHVLPSLFEDLLPVLMGNQHIVVIISMLEGLPRLNLSESARREALQYAMLVLGSSNVGGPNEQLVKPAIQCAGHLLQQLPGDYVEGERLLLGRAGQLPASDQSDILRVPWSEGARRSIEHARIRLARVIDPQTNPSYSRRHNEEEVALLECGPGLGGLTLPDLQSAALAFGPRRLILGLEIVEVAWRAGREDDARAICEALRDSVPAEPAFERQRNLVGLVQTGLERGVPLPVDEEPVDENGFPSLYFNVHQQVQVRASLRSLLRETPTTSEELVAAAASLQREASKLASAAQRATPTAAYVRLVADLSEIASHVFLREAADLNGEVRSASAHERLFRRRAAALRKDLAAAFGEDDPLGGPLLTVVTELLEDDGSNDLLAYVATWGSLLLPLVLVEGAPLTTRAPMRQPEAEPDKSIAVAMISIDDRLLTGTAVLRPDTIYTLQVELQVDEWPDWATQLDFELVGGLGPTDMQMPAMKWMRPANFEGTLRAEGTLLLHFALPSGRPAPPFAATASWSGVVDEQMRVERLDITGHGQIRLRPFDAARDTLTDIDVIDEKLLELYSSLFASGYPDDEIQAFCRLFTAVCRAGFQYTWDKRFRRGTRVTERQFHNDLYADLLADPALEGRVDRGSPLALGFLDIRHDRITAELKVERKVAVTKGSAPKYMGQATQYASADGRHLSILAILDMSPKESPVGTPENYLFTLVPALHGLDNPEAPSLVAVAVVNGNMPVPSSWSRRRKPTVE